MRDAAGRARRDQVAPVGAIVGPGEPRGRCGRVEQQRDGGDTQGRAPGSEPVEQQVPGVRGFSVELRADHGPIIARRAQVRYRSGQDLWLARSLEPGILRHQTLDALVGKRHGHLFVTAHRPAGHDDARAKDRMRDALTGAEGWL